jgi:hypothetical protein
MADEAGATPAPAAPTPSGGEAAPAPSLTPAENKYFESRGAEPAPNPNAPPPEEKPAAVVKPTVPLESLQEERARRKGLEQTAQRQAEQLARYDERFRIVEQLNRQPQQAPPDPETDIFGHARHLDQQVRALHEQNQQFTQAQQVAQQRNQLVQGYQADAARLASEVPDFKDAYKFMVESRQKELRAIGYKDPATIAQALQNDELSVVAMAIQNGNSPAEAIYALAQARGYAPQKGQTAAEKLAVIEKGQAANKSLSSTGGAAGEGEMTGEALLKMPLDEFEAWTKKNPAKARRLMGG